MMSAMDQPLDVSEKDIPLRDDIRLLGRILGDTVRSQEAKRSSILLKASAKAPSASAGTRIR